MTLPQCRVTSYNLQKCVGLDLRRRPERSLHVIEATGAQIAVLQEVDKRLPPRPAALPHDMVEDHGWQILPFGQPGGSLGWHGNAMLVRPGIEVEATAHVELPGLEPRGAIRAELHTAIGPLRVVGAHLGLIRRFRHLQMAAITRHLRDLPPRPTVLAGDFNEWRSLLPLDALAPGLHFLPSKPSFPALRPVAALDRLALSPDLQAVNQGVHLGQPARVASDHLPVWADLAPSAPSSQLYQRKHAC